jgi:bacterioferritin-associated ferredoxin
MFNKKVFLVYICVCNGIKGSQIKVAVEKGAKNWKQVHRFYGNEPNCGKCEIEITKLIRKK